MNEDYLKEEKASGQFLRSIETLDIVQALESLKGFRLDTATWRGRNLWELMANFVGSEGNEFEGVPPTVTDKGMVFLESVLPVCVEKGFNPLQHLIIEDILRYIDTPVYPLIAKLCHKHNLTDEFGSPFYVVMSEVACLDPSLYQEGQGQLAQTNVDGETVLHVLFKSGWIWEELEGGCDATGFHNSLALIEEMGGQWDIEDCYGTTPLDKMHQSYQKYVDKYGTKPGIEEFMAVCLKRHIRSEVQNQTEALNENALKTRKM